MYLKNIRLSFFDKELEILIEDNGPGIKKEEEELIFQPFYRGADTMHKQGFGLGLSLASKIIKLHKGSLEFKNNPVKGSSFIIKIPVA